MKVFCKVVFYLQKWDSTVNMYMYIISCGCMESVSLKFVVEGGRRERGGEGNLKQMYNWRGKLAQGVESQHISLGRWWWESRWLSKEVSLPFLPRLDSQWWYTCEHAHHLSSPPPTPLSFSLSFSLSLSLAHTHTHTHACYSRQCEFRTEVISEKVWPFIYLY